MKRKLPPAQQLVALAEAGMTYQEIAEWVERRTHLAVSRHSVASAIHRAGLSSHRNRYRRHLPWKVKGEHGQHYAAKMLRLMGRRDEGIALSEAQRKRLASWERTLRQTHSVVAYAPHTEEGFHYVDGDFPENGIPIIPIAIQPRSQTF